MRNYQVKIESRGMCVYTVTIGVILILPDGTVLTIFLRKFNYEVCIRTYVVHTRVKVNNASCHHIV